MRVTKDSVVKFAYIINDLGSHVVEAQQSLEYLHGGYDDVMPAVEAALHGCCIGETVQFELEPERAYGAYDLGMVCVEPRSALPEALALGDEYQLQSGAHRLAETIYRVVDIDAKSVVLDGNHPFAGKRVRVTCTVTAIRAATSAERALRNNRQRKSA